MKQKILFFSHSSRLNGSQYMLLLTIRNLNKDKFRSVVICPSKGQFVNELRKSGVKTYIIPTFNWIFFGKKSLIYHCIRSVLSITLQILTIPIFLLISLIEKPNIIYSNTTHNCTGMLTSILTNRPHIWHVHEIFTDEYYSSYLSINTITNLILRYSEKIIAVSNIVAIQFNKNISSNKITTIHNCLNEKELEANFKSMPQDVCSKNDWAISLISYITPIKKHDLAIKAIKELVPKIPNIKLLLIGASTGNNIYQKKLNYLVKSLSLENIVVFTGRRTDVMDIIKNSKVLIIPSSREGLPIVALEAMYCSTPIIASNSGGTIEVVRDKVNGRLFQPNNSHDLCEKILFFYHNPELIKIYGQNGKKILEEEFSLKQYIKNMENALL